jgi:hypothetical protein
MAGVHMTAFGVVLCGWREFEASSRSPWQRDIPGRLLSPRLLPQQAFLLVCVYSDPMEGTTEGLIEKLYWRKARGEWHCFKKLAQVRGYVSLCQRREIALVLGQQISRPEADLRCKACDDLEKARRGWDYSGPASPRRAGKLQ